MIHNLIATFALIIIAITMLLRANDLGKRPGFKWHVRRAGFVLAGLAPLGIIVQAWRTDCYGGWYMSLFLIGVALVFMTTPYLPPWWRWVWGEMTRDPTWGHQLPLFGGRKEPIGERRTGDRRQGERRDDDGS